MKIKILGLVLVTILAFSVVVWVTLEESPTGQPVSGSMPKYYGNIIAHNLASGSKESMKSEPDNKYKGTEGSLLGIDSKESFSGSIKPMLTQSESDNTPSNTPITTPTSSLDSPHVRSQRMQQRTIANLSTSYAPFFDLIMLDEQSRNEVVSILANQYESDRALEARSLSYDEEKKEVIKNNQVAEKKLKQLLGDEITRELKDYKKALPARPVAEETAKRCAANGFPMSPGKVNELAKAIAVPAIPIYPSPRSVTAEKYKILTGRDYQAISAAERILTLQQMAAFKQALAERFIIQ
jgi:hypothetical protein